MNLVYIKNLINQSINQSTNQLLVFFVYLQCDYSNVLHSWLEFYN